MFRFLNYSYLLLLSLFFFQCESTQEKSVEEKPSAISDEVSEDLLVRLSQELAMDPQTPAQQERNDILQFAIDSLWNVEETASGLWIEVVETGEGEILEWADRLEVDYIGYFLNGQQFDSSYERNRSLQFYIGNMIDGWNEALQLVKPGSQLRLLVPSRLGYGEKGLITATGDTLVPPNEVLAFKIDVLQKIQ